MRVLVPTARSVSAIAIEDVVRAIRLVAFDFDGVFTDNMVYVAQDGSEMVRCTRADGIGLRKLEKLGIHPMIISTEKNPVVGLRSRKIGIECVQGCEDKREALNAILADRRLSLEQIAFVGNDINDVPCLDCVGLPIVVRDAHPDVVPLARLQTELPGGHGAVREVCDYFEAVFKKAGVAHV